MVSKQYFGKYRARVTDINDPEKRGRIRVQCPSVLQESKSPWCEPCIPVAYDGGGDFFLPKVGDTVWIEFEEGKSSKPIWVGNWWSTNNTPSSNYSPDTRIIEFDGCKIEMTKESFKVTVNGSTFEIGNGIINLDAGSSTITMKDGKIFLN